MYGPALIPKNSTDRPGRIRWAGICEANRGSASGGIGTGSSILILRGLTDGELALMVYLSLSEKSRSTRNYIRRRPHGIILPLRADSQADRRQAFNRIDSPRLLAAAGCILGGFQLTVIPANMFAS